MVHRFGSELKRKSMQGKHTSCAHSEEISGSTISQKGYGQCFSLG